MRGGKWGGKVAVTAQSEESVPEGQNVQNRDPPLGVPRQPQTAAQWYVQRAGAINHNNG